MLANSYQKSILTSCSSAASGDCSRTLLLSAAAAAAIAALVATALFPEIDIALARGALRLGGQGPLLQAFRQGARIAPLALLGLTSARAVTPGRARRAAIEGRSASSPF